MNLVRTLGIGLLASIIILAVSLYTVHLFQKRLEKMALTDELTGAANRRGFDMQFHKSAARFARRGQAFSLILLDVDRFKEINDKFGHLEGDRVLVGVAEAVHGQVRPMDIHARWGGDEFVVLTECPLSEAVAVADRICEQVGQTLYAGPLEVPVSLSCGVAEYREGESLDDLLWRVDQALYASKGGGQGQGQLRGSRLTPIPPQSLPWLVQGCPSPCRPDST